ncbi:MAG: hypothetical protein WAP58_04590 [Peptococcia bacterium]
MVDKTFFMPQPIKPITKPHNAPASTPTKETVPFNQVLQQELQQSRELKFSRHAQARLENRQIT